MPGSRRIDARRVLPPIAFHQMPSGIIVRPEKNGRREPHESENPDIWTADAPPASWSASRNNQKMVAVVTSTTPDQADPVIGQVNQRETASPRL